MLLIFLCRIYYLERFDHIFHYTIKPNIYGSLAAKLNGIDCTAIVTGLGRLLNMQNRWKKALVYNLYRLGMVSTSHLWFLNEEDQSLFHNLDISKNIKTKILPSEGVNMKFFSAPMKKTFSSISFLFAGRLLKEKGIEHFIEAASIVKSFYPQSMFDIVGFIDLKDRDSIDPRKLLEYQSIGTIKFHGDTEDIRPFIHNSNCIVLPSCYGEGVSRTLLEAAAMKTPIITTKNRGCIDVVIDGYNGFICQASNPSNLADQMMAFITLDKEAKRVMGQNGFKLVQNKFSIDSVIAFYHDHLNFKDSPFGTKIFAIN